MTDRVAELERDGFVARHARPADVPQIAQVLSAAFPRWPAIEITCSAAEHVAWKMASPGTPVEHHSVVVEGDRVVCLKLRWIGRALLDGGDVVTDTGADFATHPAYQGRGLGRLLTDFEISGARPRGDLAMDLPPSNPIVRDRLHAKEIHSRQLSAWARPLTARAYVAAYRDRPSALLAAGRRAVSGAFDRSPVTPAVTVDSIERFDERADELWETARDLADFVRARDATYLNWRYADPRSGRRLILGATVGDRLVGWLVLRPTGAAVELVDLLIHPDHPEAAVTLLAAAARSARRRGAGSLRTWLSPGSALEQELARGGFVRRTEPIAYEFFEPRGGTGSPDLLRRLGDPALRTYVTMGDFDFN